MNKRQSEIIEVLENESGLSSSEILNSLTCKISIATLKRDLQFLKSESLLKSVGQNKGTRYHLGGAYKLFKPVEVEKYFETEIDDRQINEVFNFDLVRRELSKFELFSAKEIANLNDLNKLHARNISELKEFEYKREMERLAIDLSWKSSQIEGNTYSLLETERLLKDKKTASGKTREEATMLLNHKEAIDFIVNNPDYINPISIARIEDIHSILIKDLNVERNIRKRRVGISGTNYTPIDNEFQILEAFEAMCKLVNEKSNIFEKALLVLVLISYIHGFNDGNKRTARIISNAILMNSKSCPLSFRTIDSIEYKKAMLLFYEQNNIRPIKEIFIDQFEFAVKTYF